MIFNLAVNGELTEGQTLTISYEYSDPNSATESGTSYQWYRASDSLGTDEAIIPGATGRTYTLTGSDVSCCLCVEVTPSNGSLAGSPKKSAYTGAIAKNFFDGGIGTPEDPYIIGTLVQLEAISEHPDACFKLGADITDSLTSPIGSSSNPFTGHFDGNGNSITVHISNSSAEHVGLFAYIGTSGAVSNLTVTGTVSGASSGTQYLGALAGYNCGNINGCTSSADVTATGGKVHLGGLVGCNWSVNQNTNDRPLSSKAEIIYCNSTGRVTASEILAGSSIGGLVGANTAPNNNRISPYAYNITNSYATGDITVAASIAKGGEPPNIGGLVGYNRVISIRDCYATGDVSATNLSSAGGLIGYSRSIATIDYCFASGDVSVENCGSLSGNTCLGGLIGYLSSGTVSCAYATGDVTGANIEDKGSEYFGGLLGYLETSNAAVNRAYAAGAVTGENISTGGPGGLVGKYKAGTFSNAFWNSTKNVKSDGNSSSSYGTGRTTNQMTGSLALDADNMLELGSADFLTKANLPDEGLIFYPQLKVFAESADPAVKSASLGSVTSATGSQNFVTVIVSGSGTAGLTGATDLGDGIYSVVSGAIVNLEAEAAPGCSFIGWYSEGIKFSSLPIDTYTVTQDITLTAKFGRADASLSDLTTGGSTVSGFTADTYSYNVILPRDTLPGSPAATVGATAADSNASISITQAVELPGSATVEVTAEDGATKRTYTVYFALGEASTITTISLPGGTVGTAYSQTLAATGDTPIT